MRRIGLAAIVVLVGWAAVTTTVLAVGDPPPSEPLYHRVNQLEEQVQKLQNQVAKLREHAKQDRSGKPLKEVPERTVRAGNIEILNESDEVVFRLMGTDKAAGGASLRIYNRTGAAGVVISAGSNGGSIQLLDENGKLKKRID